MIEFLYVLTAAQYSGLFTQAADASERITVSGSIQMKWPARRAPSGLETFSAVLCAPVVVVLYVHMCLCGLSAPPLPTPPQV